MLIRLHNLVSVNPQNVAAVICGDHLFVTLRMTNGHSHNIRCQHKAECPRQFAAIMEKLRAHDDFYEVDDTRAVNVNHIISLSTTALGIVINMIGEFQIYVPTKLKPETIERLSRELEKFQ
jgi:hypothetical protein